MKAKQYSCISGAMIAKRAPQSLSAQVTLRRFDKELGTYTLIVFPCGGKDVVYSGTVRRALRKVSSTERLIAFGGCFTLESLGKLRERGAEVFAVSDFPWTDEGFTDIRNAVASPSKFPPD